jgi:hypothetical protein
MSPLVVVDGGGASVGVELVPAQPASTTAAAMPAVVLAVRRVRVLSRVAMMDVVMVDVLCV